MGLRQRFVQWSSQPQQAVAANPFWIDNGLVALFDVRAGIEIISGARPIADSTTRSSGVGGVRADFSGSITQRYAHRPEFAVTGPITIFVYCDVAALSNYGALIAKQTSPINNVAYELRLGAGASDSKITFVRSNAAGTYRSDDTTVNQITAPANAVRLIIADPFGDLSALTRTTRVNGVKSGMATNGGGIDGVSVADGGAEVWIGRRSDGATQLAGSIYHIALFRGALPDDLQMRLDAEPFSVYEPQRLWAPRGSVAPTFNPAWARGSNIMIGAGVAQ